jgi:hypothetical protein
MNMASAPKTSSMLSPSHSLFIFHHYALTNLVAPKRLSVEAPKIPNEELSYGKTRGFYMQLD